MAVEVFIDVYRRYYRVILTVAQQRLAGSGSAEDITSEVFRIAWVHFQNGGELSLPWLYQALRNLVGNEYKRMARSPEILELDSGYSWATEPGPESEEAIDIRRLMMELGVDDREILFMSYWEDLSRAEIAAILGCSESAVGVRLFRARSRLATKVKAHERLAARRGE